MERQKYIAKSESLNKQLEDTRHSIEELRKQLSEQETEESLEEKIKEVRSLCSYQAYLLLSSLPLVIKLTSSYQAYL